MTRPLADQEGNEPEDDEGRCPYCGAGPDEECNVVDCDADFDDAEWKL